MLNIKENCALGVSLLVSVGIVVSTLASSTQTAVAAEHAAVTLAQSTASLMLTTTESFEGYQIKEYKGIVRGVMVREPGPVSSFKAGLKGIVGGKVSPFIRMCDSARQQAMDAMIEKAQAAGANAVVGFRYDSSAFGDGDDMGTEVVCYGTAVTIIPRENLRSASVPR